MKINLLLLAGLLMTVGTMIRANADGPNPSDSRSDEESGTLKRVEKLPILLAPPDQKSVDKSKDGWRAASKNTKSTSNSSSPGETQQTSLDSSRDSDELGFRSLLTGRKLKGWIVQDGSPEAWSREGDIIRCKGREGGWLRTEDQYSDFHVKFEYLLEPGGNTGFGVRSPSTGSPSFDGIEIQLIDETSSKYADLQPSQLTGSIYYQAARQRDAKLMPSGEWNRCEIICRGDELTVVINGESVNTINLATPPVSLKKSWRLAERPPLGHFALQSHTSSVAFRSLRVKDLTQAAKSNIRYLDLSIGDGDTIDDAKTFSVHYVGQLGTGQRFADTRDLGDPVEVSMEDVIPGWEIGLAGMKVGGKRRLIVPPEQGFGEFGATNLIPPGATLVFEVELCAVQR